MPVICTRITWAFSFLTKPVSCWNYCTAPSCQQALVRKCGKCLKTAGESCGSGTSYTQVFHCRHHDIQQLKRKVAVEITLHAHGHIQCSSLCPHPCFRDGGSKHTAHSRGAPFPLLQGKYSNWFCITPYGDAPAGPESPPKRKPWFLYNTTKQLVKLNTEVVVNGNQATWNRGKCSQSK